MSTTRKEELEIRRNIVQAGLVDCIVSMPSNLFYTVTIPVCLWFLSRQRANRKNKILFIDARKMGFMETRIHRELHPEEIQKICSTYHSWQNGNNYKDIAGYCKSISINEISKNEYVLSPGRYIDQEEIQENEQSSRERLEILIKDLQLLLEQSDHLEEKIRNNLNNLGYDI